MLEKDRVSVIKTTALVSAHASRDGKTLPKIGRATAAQTRQIVNQLTASSVPDAVRASAARACVLLHGTTVDDAKTATRK